MQTLVRQNLARAAAFVSIPVLLILMAGCPISNPPPDNTNTNGNGNGNTNGNTNDNIDPPPGQDLITVTVVGDGEVSQSASGTTVTLTATADAGWGFTGWSGEATSTDNPLIVDAEIVSTITATFTILTTGSDCNQDQDCNDTLFCTGLESCTDGDCVDGTPPCGNGESCDEDADACIPDADGDGVSDNDDNCPNNVNPGQVDSENDGIGNACDNCPGDVNPDQADANGNDIGDVCEGDRDGDGIADLTDNCVDADNTDQADEDADGLGDVCDICPNDNANDADNDGVCGDIDQCENSVPREVVNALGCPAGGGTTPTCGNGVPDPGEACDDGNTTSGDECDSNCTPTGCGNGVVTAGETCDDGNTISGDGCDATCQDEPGGPVNDSCANPITVTDGTTDFSNVGASMDGPNEPEICNFFGEARIIKDVWFCYEATCDGPAVASLCGSDYDTKMAVYEGCDCPTTIPLGCSDDDCGGGFDSRLEFQVQAGQSYMIRVGGFEGGDRPPDGDGILTVRCDPQECGQGNGECFQANDSPGCDDAECCEKTCVVDPYCCDVEWDDTCAAEATGLCTGQFEACAAGAGSCSGDGHADGQGGCDEVDCCNTVCLQDPFCCVDTWDDLCVENSGLCFLSCGGQNGSCFLPNGSPGCDKVTCCEAVCTDDPFCCSIDWDQSCADLAATTHQGSCR